MSIYVKPDDEAVSIASFSLVEEEEGSVGQAGDFGVLAEAAVSAQRLLVSRMARRYTKGRMDPGIIDHKRLVTPEKRFSVPRYVEWLSDDPVGLVDMLKSGRVRTRLMGATGKGKTTRLAPYLAEQLNVAVCLVTTDAGIIGQVRNWTREKGGRPVRSVWPKRPGAYVHAMTYDDFCGYAAAGQRADLFRCFQVFIFDEAQVTTAAVYVAKAVFAAFAREGTSLVLCSATISTDRENDRGAAGLGSFSTVAMTMSVESAIASGKLIDKYLRDRAVAMVPRDVEVWTLRAYYEANGVEVRGLDSAASDAEMYLACQWLQGDSATPRVLVLHSSCAVGFNFPISFMLLWAQQADWQEVHGVWKEVVRPMDDATVLQAMSRTGRGMVDGSGGMIMTVERAKEVEIFESERVRAFLMLISCSIVPMKNGKWADCYEIFPEDMTATSAFAILKFCIPPEIAARYFCKDGYIASKFTAAVNTFLQPDHFLMSSEEELPPGYDEWPEEEIGGYGKRDGIQEHVLRIPVRATGELRVVLHAISAMAEGKISVQRWRPRVDIDSDSDGPEERSAVVSFETHGLRRVEDHPLISRAPVVGSSTGARWRMELQPRGLVEPPVARVRFTETQRFKEALQVLELSLNDYHVETPRGVAAATMDGIPATEIEMPTEGVADGVVIQCLVSSELCAEMSTGVALSFAKAAELTDSVNTIVKSFVYSKFFDKLSGPWDSILQTLLTEGYIDQIGGSSVDRGLRDLVFMLQRRFAVEIPSVMAFSRVYRRRYAGLFPRPPTTDDLMLAIYSGKFDKIARTDGFLDRVRYIKQLLDKAWLRTEARSAWLPAPFSPAQRQRAMIQGAPAWSESSSRRSSLHERFERGTRERWPIP